MNVIVRLYWQHDLDLVALTLHPMFEMGKWMKKAMIAYAQGDEEFHIPLPQKCLQRNLWKILMRILLWIPKTKLKMRLSKFYSSFGMDSAIV